METVIKTKNLSKVYGNIKALDDVSIQVNQGDIYGLIGRNGAGKTTLMKIINRQIRASEGTVNLLGNDFNQSDNFSLKIGTLIEDPGIYPEFNARQNLELKCDLVGYKPKGYIDSLLELVMLKDAGKKKAKNFSLGMKQRLGLALALVGQPDILLLDEPTNGMDPQGIQDFRETIIKLNREKNITIVISSHILGELSKFITKLGIIDQGKLIKEASMKELEEINRDHIILKSNNLKSIISFLEEKINLSNFKVVSDTEVHIFEHLESPEVITHELIKKGLLFDIIYLERSSLEDMFLSLTGGSAHA